MSIQYGPVYDRTAYAGFVRRTLALIIDAVLLMAAYSLVPWVWYIAAPAALVTESSYDILDMIMLPATVVYLIGLRLTENGTLGYRIMRIRYAYMFARKAGVWTILFRATVAVFLLWFFALDHFWILFDERKQAWHDKVSGFYVIKCGAQPIGEQRIVRRVIEFMMLTFVVWEPAGADQGSGERAATTDG